MNDVVIPLLQQRASAVQDKQVTSPGVTRLRVFVDVLVQHPATRVFCALVVLGLVYRLRLVYTLLTHSGAPFGFRASDHSALSLSQHYASDLLMAATAAGLVALLVGIGRLAQRVLPRLLLVVVGLTLLHAALAAIAITYHSHYGLMFSIQTGLTREAIVETFTGGTFGESFKLIGALDVAFLCIPIGLFWLLRLLPRGVTAWSLRGGVTLAALALILRLAYGGSAAASGLAGELRQSPVWFTASDVLRGQGGDSDESTLAAGLGVGAARASRPDHPGPSKTGPGSTAPGVDARWLAMTMQTQQRSVQLIHPLFTTAPPPPASSVVPAPGSPWNFLFVILESTGLRYAFDNADGRKMPMPYLHKLAQEGLQLSNHFSPSNSSASSLFAIYSGLHPMPQVRIYAVHPRLGVPSLASMLDKSYDRFLVTPASLTWFFPKGYFERSGLTELWGVHNLPIHRNAPRSAMARDEHQTVSFFLKRLRSARQPFLATYYSFAAHWPYGDPGPQYHVRPTTRRVWEYLNNLRFLDRQIERIFEQLKADKLDQKTIVVLVGDHGEAFGQHQGNWTHSRGSFNENYQTPAVIWQPRLFPAHVVREPTSHVDILPTVLDAAGVSYDRRLLQGESLYEAARARREPQYRRRYLFLWGNENTVSSIDQQRWIKLQVSFKNRSCWAFDLKADPDEKKPLRCRAFEAQHRALLLYRQYQTDLLQDYNKAALAKQPFHGIRVN